MCRALMHQERGLMVECVGGTNRAGRARWGGGASEA